MTDTRRRLLSIHASPTTLASLAAIYVLVVAGALALAIQLLPVLESPRWAIFAGTLAVAVPVGLVVSIGIAVARLVRDLRLRRTGSRLKTRLTTSFALIVILFAGPQALISVTLVTRLFDVAFASGTGDALRTAVTLSVDTYDRITDELETLAIDGTLDRLIADPAARGDLWDAIRLRQPSLLAIQARDPDLFLGDVRFRRVALPDVAPGSTGVTRMSVGDVDTLQLLAGLEPTGSVLVTIAVPLRLAAAGREITAALDAFERVEALGPRVFQLTVLLYGLFVAPLLLLGVLAGFLFADRIIRPIETLEAATRRVAEGDYSVRMLARPSEDLGTFVLSFNHMVNEVERARRRMAQTEKVQAWREIAQRLAHEVKNPLTPIRLAAERMRRKYEADDPEFGSILNRTVDTIVREVDALTNLLNEFRTFSRIPAPAFETVSLRELLESAASAWRDDPRVAFSVDDVDPSVVVRADPRQLRQVFLNLVTNAVHAGGGRIAIRCSADRILAGGADTVRIRISDDGPGIPEPLREQVFQPYVTGTSDGTGLGLAIVDRIVFDHDGRISFETVTDVGTTFIIDLPAAPDALEG